MSLWMSQPENKTLVKINNVRGYRTVNQVFAIVWLSNILRTDTRYKDGISCQVRMNDQIARFP